MLARFSSFGRRDLPRAAVSVSQLARRTVSTESSLSVVSSNKCFGGNVTRYSHPSETVKTDMGCALRALPSRSPFANRAPAHAQQQQQRRQRGAWRYCATAPHTTTPQLLPPVAATHLDRA